MSDFNLLSEEHKDILERIANNLISGAEYSVVYEDSDLQWESDELQLQAHHYLTGMISASRDDK